MTASTTHEVLDAMLQMRSGDGRAYNPSRDIVQLFPRVIAYWAAVSLHPGKCAPALRDYAKHVGLTPADIQAAEQGLAKFVALSVHADVEDINTIFVQSGLDRLSGPTMLALMSSIGEVTMRVFFKTIRDATRYGASVPGASELGLVAEKASFAFATDLPSAQAKRHADAEKAAMPSIIENDPTTPS